MQYSNIEKAGQYQNIEYFLIAPEKLISELCGQRNGHEKSIDGDRIDGDDHSLFINSHSAQIQHTQYKKENKCVTALLHRRLITQTL